MRWDGMGWDVMEIFVSSFSCFLLFCVARRHPTGIVVVHMENRLRLCSVFFFLSGVDGVGKRKERGGGGREDYSFCLNHLILVLRLIFDGCYR